jgi:uncharacterized protein YndB with AHSA1/START domain
MRHALTRTIATVGTATVCLAAAVALDAHTPSAHRAQGPTSTAAAKPTYSTIRLEIDVARPVAEVWRRVGKFCDIAEWLQIPDGCRVISGTDGDVGAVRTVGNEVMIAKTEYSYTYLLSPPILPYHLYGTLEARATSPTTTKLLYVMLFDNSMLPDAAAREKDEMQKRATFTRALNNMKTLAEGGVLSPPARK